MNIKLIASDLDGTLLRDDKTLSPYTLSVLARCRAQGILFVPTTARPPRTLENWIPGLEYDGALCHNGGVALYRGEIVWEQGVVPQVAGPLLRRLRDTLPGTALSAEVSGTLYANFPADRLWPGIAYTFTDFAEDPAFPAEKLMVGLRDPAQLDTVKSLLPEGLAAQITENTLIMIQLAQVDKGKALTALCEHLGIAREETVAFGDDWNDIPLLQAAGWSVAVANALSQVKAVAKELCLSNQEDGPARWLAAHVLESEKELP